MIFCTAALADASTFLENVNVETNQKIVNVITQLDSAKELSSVKKVHDFDGSDIIYQLQNRQIPYFGWVGSQYTDVVCSSPASAAFVSSACAITYY